MQVMWNCLRISQWQQRNTPKESRLLKRKGESTLKLRYLSIIYYLYSSCWGPEYLVGSVLGSLSCFMQHHGFNPPPRRIFLVKGIFPLELSWVLSIPPSPLPTPIPPTPPTKISFRWEYKPRSSLCTHALHLTDSKDPDVHVLATETHPACTIHEDVMWLPQWLD